MQKTEFHENVSYNSFALSPRNDKFEHEISFITSGSWPDTKHHVNRPMKFDTQSPEKNPL